MADRPVDRSFIVRAKRLASLGLWTPGQELERKRETTKPRRRVVWRSAPIWFENERRRKQNRLRRRRRRNEIAKKSRARNRRRG